MNVIRISDFKYSNNITFSDIEEGVKEALYHGYVEASIDDDVEDDIEDLINGKVVETEDYLSIERIINELSYLKPNGIFSYIGYNLKDNSYYKVYFKEGKDYSVEGKLVFEDFDIEKLE